MIKAALQKKQNSNKRMKLTALALGITAACVVIMMTIFPAITMQGDNNTVCGLEEHTHTQECYESQLICTEEEGDEHTHSDECYETVLICGKQEHIHTQDCYEKDEPVPLQLTLYGNTYEAVRESEFDGDSAYLIVSANANKALTLDGSETVGRECILQPYGTVFEAEAKTESLWSIQLCNKAFTVQNVADSRYYLSLENNANTEKEPSTVELIYHDDSGTWTFEQNGKYLTIDKDSIKSAKSSEAQGCQWLILKQCNTKPKKTKMAASVNNSSENIDAASLVTHTTSNAKKVNSLLPSNAKVDAKGYIEPSDSISGERVYQKNLWQYDSDPATSKLESQFDGVSYDDGKVLADKSVIYGKDDYGAFDEYAFGTFGVELSALAQQYNVLRKEIIEVPVDVVFVIDTSGSMKNNNVSTGESRAQAAVNALNTAMDTIIKTNPDNRVGVIKFSNAATVFAPLNYYKNASNGKYLSYDGTDIKVDMTTTAGQRITDATVSGYDWSGTYTQHGIAKANEMLQAADTTYIDSQGNVLQRKPIVILLSDGEPTYCTSNYSDVLNGPHYGNGVYTQNTNNRGVQGYYTVLSAVYYKNQIAQHYQNSSAAFYTIGLGIDPTSVEPMLQSPASQAYTRAVLNPTSANVAAADNSSVANNSVCGGMFRRLMMNTYTSSTVSVGSTTNAALGRTSATVPVIKNPYIDTGYSYANGAYFGNMSTEELTEVFKSIIRESIEKVEYGFNLKENTSATITDPIGEGMEVKGVPVLRYNGTNYEVTSQSTEKIGGKTVTTYVYDYIATDENILDKDGNARSVKLKDIRVTVTTDSSGNQTVEMDVPEGAMPVYSPDYETRIYAEELPVRLIFQVAPTDEALANAKAGDVFYTNRYTDAQTQCVINPSDINPYYEYDEDKGQVIGNYRDSTATKTENTTETLPNSSDYKSNKDASTVNITLGNNGRLQLIENKEFISIDAVKIWQDKDGKQVSDTGNLPPITVMLYRSLNGEDEKYIASAELSNANGYLYTFKQLPYGNDEDEPYTYTLREIVPDGYYVNISDGISGNDGVITVVNRKLPDSGSIAVKKKWLNYIGNPVSDSALPSVDVELWRHTTIVKPSYVTVTITGSGNTLQTLQVKKGSNVSFTVRVNYSSSSRRRNAVISLNGNTVTSTASTGNTYYRTTNTQTFTANSDLTLAYTSTQSPGSFSVQNLSYTPPDSEDGGTEEGEDERIETVTLSFKSNWQHFFDGLTLSEVKDGNTYIYYYYVKELTEIPNYSVSYSDNNKQGIQGGELMITNRCLTTMDVLPETGSTGCGGYILAGAAFAAIALTGLLICSVQYAVKRRRDRL